MIKITSLTILSASLPRSPMDGATGGDRQVPGDATGVLFQVIRPRPQNTPCIPDGTSVSRI